MDVFKDQRIVMTLDAGGTNFVFSALQAGNEIVEPVRLASQPNDLDRCLNTIIQGFNEIKSKLNQQPVAISFAFPGPTDYPAGIIGDLENLPCFRGGVALGPMLEEVFELPVFINNDGDLFTYGEAMAGLLPEINQKLEGQGLSRRYKNLFGVTVGTGFGGGIVINNQLCVGDNSASGEIWATRNFKSLHLTAEEGVSIRAIRKSYLSKTDTADKKLMPKDIYNIALGNKEGDNNAARAAFNEMAEVLAEALANAITLIDGIMVIGGGICGASALFLPRVIEWLNGTIETQNGKNVSRLVSRVYNLEEKETYDAFLSQKHDKITVPFSTKKVTFFPEKKLAVGVTRLGTNKATALGAYAFALSRL